LTEIVLEPPDIDGRNGSCTSLEWSAETVADQGAEEGAEQLVAQDFSGYDPVEPLTSRVTTLLLREGILRL